VDELFAWYLHTAQQGDETGDEDTRGVKIHGMMLRPGVENIANHKLAYKICALCQ
jgi:hypothetical protein